jgi:hypothetical protein
LEVVGVKRLGLFGVFLIAAILLMLFGGLNISRASVEMSVKQYEDFHRVLHPLEHEAIPRKDYAKIRMRANELIELGNAIVILGVPAGTKSDVVEQFKAELSKFRGALASFGEAAKNGKDEQVKDTFGAVHDSFEMLASMLPHK